MLDEATRTAILRLAREGHGARTIAASLGIARSTVRDVLARGDAAVLYTPRATAYDPHLERIRALHVSCRGNLVRVHEELVREGVAVASYSTLTRFCHDRGIGVSTKPAVGVFTFAVGEEMQHDTSPHKVEIGGKRRVLQCASLVLCYSRLRYCQVYPSFNRTTCKGFLSEALQFFGGSARRCMIDNSSVILAGGSGKNAVFSAEMEAFARRFGFAFEAHAPGYAERSARVERSFHEIENNFYPGRSFENLSDCNTQMRTWCETKNGAFRRHLQASPIELFAAERPSLVALPLHIPEVAEVLHRTVDTAGEVRIETNRYSVPDRLAGESVEVLASLARIRIVHRHVVVVEYPREEAGANRRVRDPSHRSVRRAQFRRQPLREERVLTAAGPAFAAMVERLRSLTPGRAARQIRRLHQMFLDYPTPELAAALARCLEFGLTDLERIEPMVIRTLGKEFFRMPLPEPPEDDANG